MSIFIPSFFPFPLLLIIAGIIFLPSIKSTEFLFPTEPIDQSNSHETGKNSLILRGILLPSIDRPNKLLHGEIIYTVKIEFTEYKAKFPDMEIFVKTNEFGGFMAKIPAKYEATNKTLVLTFINPRNEQASIKCIDVYPKAKFIGCRIGLIHAEQLSNKILIELEDEFSKFKARKNNPSLVPWETFDEILFKLKKIDENEKSEKQLIEERFKKTDEENTNIRREFNGKLDEFENKLGNIENKLKEKGFWKRILNA